MTIITPSIVSDIFTLNTLFTHERLCSVLTLSL